MIRKAVVDSRLFVAGFFDVCMPLKCWTEWRFASDDLSLDLKNWNR